MTANYDPNLLTKSEKVTLSTLATMQMKYDRTITPDEVMEVMEHNGHWSPPANGRMLTMRRLKSIIVKMGDKSPIVASYKRGRGSKAMFKLKRKEV